MEEHVLVLNPLGKNLTKNQKNIISLIMKDICIIKISEFKNEKHILSDTNIAGIIIDMRNIPDELPQKEEIKRLMFLTTACKSLQNLDIIFAGNKEKIKKHFDFLKKDMKFIEQPQDGIPIFLN